MPKDAIPAAGEAMPKNMLDNLTFTALRDGKQLPRPVGDQLPRCFWHVVPTGDYYKDSSYGRQLALEYLAFEESDRDGPGRLQMIVRDMPRQLTAIEISFLTMVSYAARAGAATARRVSAYWDKCAAEKLR